MVLINDNPCKLYLGDSGFPTVPSDQCSGNRELANSQETEAVVEQSNH